MVENNVNAQNPLNELHNMMKRDKKAEGIESINFVVINGFAYCTIKKTTWRELADYVDD